MDCRQSRDWLFQADDPRPHSCHVPGIREHLAQCPDCQTLSAELIGVEEAWRDIPLPASADAARVAFLEKLPARSRTLPLARPQMRRRPERPRWLAAAMILLGIGVGTWILVPTPEAHAAPALIERLVDWNLDLARAGSAGERKELFAAREDALKRDVEQVPLPGPDRALAHLLLDNGTWLATHDDPIAAAERFSAVADRLVERMALASARREHRLANRYAKLQSVVTEHGVAHSLAKAEASGALNFEQRRHLEKIILNDEKRMQALAELLERNPNLSRKDIRRAIDPKPGDSKPKEPKAKKSNKRPAAAKKQKPPQTSGESSQP
jgi:hypothetical protein